MSTYILLVLGGLFLTLFLLFRTKEGGMLPASLKTVTSFLFVATAIAGAVNNYIATGVANVSKLTFTGLVILGLVSGLVGDLTLDLKVTYQTTNIRHSDIYTFFGMAAFGIGHILYIAAVGVYFGFSAWTILIAVGATAAIFAISLFLLKMKFGKFLIPSVCYALLLTLFLACTVAGGIIAGFTLPVILLVVGAALFLLSDLVLSMIYFDGNDSRVLIVVNHVLYYAAQFLIALSVYYIGMPL
ncbi:MAG TPA: hypothetical protein DCG79_02720 [Clostridiales bacterium]|nr:hypothetical protein [Clostridiales bacterium]